MDNLIKQEQEVQKQLSTILDKLLALREKKDKAALSVAFEKGLNKIHQLYYLKLYQFKKTNSKTKSEEEKKILANYKDSLINFIFLFQ